MNPFLKILLSIGMVILLFHCKKDPTVPPEPTDSYYVNDTFLRYWYFPEGSWWVYKRMDTTADVYDTAAVVRSEREMVFDDMAPFEWEHYQLNIEHSYFHPKVGDKSRKLNQLINNVGGSTDRISSTSNGHGFSYTYFFSWPIDSASITEKSIGGGGGSILLDTHDVQLPIGKISNVVHLYHGSRDEGVEVWLARDIGFIKYILIYPDSSTWELTNYYINN